MEQVLDLTADVFSLEKECLFHKSNTRPGLEEKNRIAARNFAMYLMRTDFNVQCQEVAEVFGFGDYSRASVLCTKMAERLNNEPDFQKKATLIRSRYSLGVYGGKLNKVRWHQKALYSKQVEELKEIAEKIVKPFREKIKLLHTKIDSLDMPDRHKKILKLRCSGDTSKDIPSYDALGQPYGITRERVRQILMAGLKKLDPLLDQQDIHPDVLPEEFEKVRLIVELQNL